MIGTREGDRNASDQEGAKELELAVDEAILACGGDMREAIRALLVANSFLEDQLASATPAISYGYARGHYGRDQG